MIDCLGPLIDSDGQTDADSADKCPGQDHLGPDSDGDGLPDLCDSYVDTDGDTVPDARTSVQPPMTGSMLTRTVCRIALIR